MTDRLAVLAHELRSPVAALAALAERAGDPDLPPESRERLVALALAAGRDVVRLVADPELLSLRPVEIAMPALLEGVAPDGAVTAEAVTLTCDPTRIRQAVANLVANGLRHGTAVTVAAATAGGDVHIRVADDGPGVAAGIDPFAPGVSTAGSTGVGLWLARAIAEAHGGRLELSSGPGQGAVFTLVLPRASGARG